MFSRRISRVSSSRFGSENVSPLTRARTNTNIRIAQRILHLKVRVNNNTKLVYNPARHRLRVITTSTGHLLLWFIFSIVVEFYNRTISAQKKSFASVFFLLFLRYIYPSRLNHVRVNCTRVIRPMDAVQRRRRCTSCSRTHTRRTQ
jgi:hypothetical protein